MGGAYIMHVRDEKYKQNFNQRTWREKLLEGFFKWDLPAIAAALKLRKIPNVSEKWYGSSDRAASYVSEMMVAGKLY
jgi:hypothetical protein